MFSLTRLIYTSHATFDVDRVGISDHSGIHPNVTSILEQSRQNNYRAGLSGVLYYADGFFFQCVEGSRRRVIELLERLQQDDRHEGMKISSLRRIHKRYFTEWTMKYVPVSEHVLQHVRERGYEHFDPTKFDESDINGLIDLFTRMDSSASDNHDSDRYSRPRARRIGRLFFSL